MNDEGIEWAIRELLPLRDRVAAQEEAIADLTQINLLVTKRIAALEGKPAPITFPAIEPERLPSVQAAERLGYAPFGYEERS
jgi:hypothetical protein